MAKSRPPKRILESYTIKGSDKVIKREALPLLVLIRNLRVFWGEFLVARLLWHLTDSLILFRPAGDCVLMRAFDASKPPYVARVEAIEAAGSRGTNVRVRVRWYYRPEESIGGRRPFHGSKEVFLSDHYDVQSADTIEGKCNVHSFRSYTKLDSVCAEDFFCRFEYKSATGSFVPDRIAVFCKCEMPYNPDDLMIQCEECSDW
nr:unnamed protein product [Digitaria exilis]